MKDYYPPLEERDLPNPPSWKKALGVGVVVMGLAMGTGELILWPHLVTKHGLGLLWLALLGMTAQFFINREVARHSVATGESFFTTSSRMLKWIPVFWFFSAILLYIWPGWASALGTTLSVLFGFGEPLYWSWATLALVLLLTFSGRIAYTMLEGSLKITVPSFFILLIIISFFNLDTETLLEAARGLSNIGGSLNGVDINVLLGAIVFSGAGGMLNLVVSLWYRDKQIGMGQYVGRITNPITGKPEAVAATGFKFIPDEINMARWRGWMRFVNIDQGIIFYLIGFITLMLISLNAYAVLAPKGLVPEGLEVAVVQAHIFGDQWGPIGFKAFLAMAFLMLFSVMWTVIDALTRMVSDILYTNSHAGPYAHRLSWLNKTSVSKLYYTSITCILICGSLLLTLKQPLTLLVISGVLSGLSMALYTPLLIYLNNTRLPKQIRPSWSTNVMMSLISIFFLYFAYRIILQNFETLFS